MRMLWVGARTICADRHGRAPGGPGRTGRLSRARRRARTAPRRWRFRDPRRTLRGSPGLITTARRLGCLQQLPQALGDPVTGLLVGRRGLDDRLQAGEARQHRIGGGHRVDGELAVQMAASASGVG